VGDPGGEGNPRVGFTGYVRWIAVKAFALTLLLLYTEASSLVNVHGLMSVKTSAWGHLTLYTFSSKTTDMGSAAVGHPGHGAGHHQRQLHSKREPSLWLLSGQLWR
jgi:hypothetical protein